jgi:hypothetical protein
VHSGRTVTGMTASATDQRMVEDWNAGLEIPDIAARYAVPPAYVDRVLDDARAAAGKKPKRDWSWNQWPNRAGYSFLTGFAVNLLLGTTALGTFVMVLLFVGTTAIVSMRRR